MGTEKVGEGVAWILLAQDSV